MVACVSAFDELTYLRSSSSSSSRSLAARFFALDMVAGRGVRCSCSAGASVKGQRPFDLVFFSSHHPTQPYCHGSLTRMLQGSLLQRMAPQPHLQKIEQLLLGLRGGSGLSLSGGGLAAAASVSLRSHGTKSKLRTRSSRRARARRRRRRRRSQQRQP